MLKATLTVRDGVKPDAKKALGRVLQAAQLQASEQKTAFLAELQAYVEPYGVLARAGRLTRLWTSDFMDTATLLAVYSKCLRLQKFSTRLSLWLDMREWEMAGYSPDLVYEIEFGGPTPEDMTPTGEMRMGLEPSGLWRKHGVLFANALKSLRP